MSIIRITDSDMASVNKANASLKSFFKQKEKQLNRPITYNIHTYGCQLNESDSEKIQGMLENVGLVSSIDEHADIVLFNTCSIRENAEDRLFGNLGVYKADKRKNKDIIIAVCGCMMKVEENVERIKRSFPYVDLVFDPQQLHAFPCLLLDCIMSSKQQISISQEDYIADDSLLPVSRQRKFRALVPIMYGCNNFCTYCIVPFTRGRERSRDFNQVVAELKDLASKGYKEVMLLGQNVNSYGMEEGSDKTFPDLLRAAAEIEGFSRVRFMTSHPKNLSDEVIDIMASYKNLETHLHLPVQSGSDAVLSRMNRHYNREQYLRTAMLFRDRLPEGSISTDIIVGFPGETEQDFEDTLSLVKTVAYDSAFTFQYSPRPGTKAAAYENQISHEVVTERFGRLLELQNSLTFDSNKRKVGLSEEVLIEGESSTGPNILSGRTRSNHLVNFKMPDEYSQNGIPCCEKLGLNNASDFEGKLCKVKITDARPYSIEGTMESLIDG